MTGWVKKRFWKNVSTVRAGDGFTVQLDGREVKTPAKAPLVVPTRAMADAIAEEWAAQEGEIAPLTMPTTRSANAAIDKVGAQRREVVGLIAAYGETDLLCYRADGPAGLVARQDAGWDPLLAWAASKLGAPLVTTSGIMHVAQPPESLAQLARAVEELTNFELAAMHDLVALSGSLVIGLAAARGVMDPDALWRASRIDEEWQEEHWGTDEEEADRRAHKHREFLHAHRFFVLARG